MEETSYAELGLSAGAVADRGVELLDLCLYLEAGVVTQQQQ